jgi:hypothetical protein
MRLSLSQNCMDPYWAFQRESMQVSTVKIRQFHMRWYPQALDSSPYNLCPWKNAHPICLVMSSWRHLLAWRKQAAGCKFLNFQRLVKMEVLGGRERQSLYKCSSYCYQFQSQSSCWIIVIVQCASTWREHLKGHLAWRESHYSCTKLVLSMRRCKNISHTQV